MTRKFDLIIVGSGSAASNLAAPCVDAGWRIAMVDDRPFGGTCANRGCDPKKVLLGAAEVADATRQLRDRGVSPAAGVDWMRLMEFKRTFTDPVPERTEKWLHGAGVEAVHGRARFVGPTELEVDGVRFQAEKIALACGARPASLGIPGEEFLSVSDDFLDLSELPPRIIFLGGGYIAFEFAHLAARAGSTVTILHRGARPLEHFDADLVQRLVEKSRALGITVHLGARVVAVKEHRGQRIAVYETAEGMHEIAADQVVHAAGRTPNVDALDLTRGAVAVAPAGVKVNRFLQSESNPNVYAAGDCAASGGPPLTPIASYEGAVAAENLLHGNRREVAYPEVPSVVFTIPSLASVGLTEEAARRQGLSVKVKAFDMSWWYSTKRLGEDTAAAKIVIEEGSGKLLGAHLFGPGSSEMINVFAVAMKARMTAAELKSTIFAYPTHGSDIKYLL